MFLARVAESDKKSMSDLLASDKHGSAGRPGRAQLGEPSVFLDHPSKSNSTTGPVSSHSFLYFRQQNMAG